MVLPVITTLRYWTWTFGNPAMVPMPVALKVHEAASKGPTPVSVGGSLPMTSASGPLIETVRIEVESPMWDAWPAGSRSTTNAVANVPLGWQEEGGVGVDGNGVKTDVGVDVGLTGVGVALNGVGVGLIGVGVALNGVGVVVGNGLVGAAVGAGGSLGVDPLVQEFASSRNTMLASINRNVANRKNFIDRSPLFSCDC